ncbi:MAG TPA: TadE family protein [Microlunatus sp.]|nr:TadE family protein [Microlunatus sp.]
MSPRRPRSDRGAAAVEFALVVPLLIVMVIGIAEFGRAFFVQATMGGAAREGVRAMALANPASSGPAAGIVAAQNALGMTGPVLQPGAACPTSGATPANATFTITYQLPLITNMFGATIPLTAQGVMRCNG